jgi:hypothetical protein
MRGHSNVRVSDLVAFFNGLGMRYSYVRCYVGAARWGM